MTIHGYAQAAPIYVDRGWRPIPLLPGKKKPFLKGITGQEGRTATDQDIASWSKDFPEMALALRLPLGFIGIDVDQYDLKQGGRTLGALQARRGPLPPTYVSTSRTDGVSGIRLYRIPAELTAWKGKLIAEHDDGTVTSDIEVVHFGHRYVTSWPSVHSEGRQYRWLGPDGRWVDGPPSPEDLPHLPPAWVQELMKETAAVRRVGRKGNPGTSTTPESLTALLAAGSPCEAVREQRSKIVRAMEVGSRHDAILGPVLQLCRLGQFGHPGVPKVLEELKTEFIDRVQDTRTEVEANREWSNALSGIPELLGDKRPPVHSLCACHDALYEVILADRKYFTPRGQTLERRVLGYLVQSALRRQSRLVVESQRQIAHAVETGQATVAKTIRRLVELGWLRNLGPGPGSDTNRYLLTDPATVIDVSALPRKERKKARSKADTPMTTTVHHLFGSQGLRGGHLDTFAALPERYRRFGRHVLVYVTKGSAQAKPLPEAYRSRRSLPRAVDGPGRTVAELHAIKRTSKQTLRRQLLRLEANGMALREGKRWWRYRFDPDWLAAQLQIPRTDLLRKSQFDKDREQFNRSRAELPEGHPKRLESELIDGHLGYVHPETGEIRWMAPEPEEPDE